MMTCDVSPVAMFKLGQNIYLEHGDLLPVQHDVQHRILAIMRNRVKCKEVAYKIKKKW